MTDSQQDDFLPLNETDFETRSNEERRIWSAEQLRDLASGSAGLSGAWLQGFSLLGCANYHSPNHVIPLEAFAHHFEIIFVDKGRQQHWLDGKSYILESGDCFFIQPMQKHSTAEKAEERGRFYWWIFDPSTGLLGLDTQRSQLLLQVLRQGFQDTAVRRLSHKNGLQMCRILTSLFGEWAKPLARSPEQNLLSWEHALLSLFFSIIHKQAEPSSRSPKSQENPYLQGICSYICEHIRGSLSLEHLCQLTPYSQSHLLRLFRKEYGLPLRDYINGKKIYAAQEMLRQGLSVTRVAMDLGFASSQYFALVFRRYIGLNPTQWLIHHAAENYFKDSK